VGDLELSAMRIYSVMLVAAGLFANISLAQAFDKFIPLGAGYSTEVSSLPELNSDSQALINQSDIYETEIYNKQLDQQRHNSYIKHFFNDVNRASSDFSVDY
jgi:hypothetical protein